MPSWNTNQGEYGMLASLVVQSGPYGGSFKPDHFKKRAQVDNNSCDWRYPPGSPNTVEIVRAIRLPVEIVDATLDDDVSKPTETEEWILVGVSKDAITNESGTDWQDNSNSPPKNLDKLGVVLVREMVPPKINGIPWQSKKGPKLEAQDQSDIQVSWPFRGRDIRLERTLRIAFILISPDTSQRYVAYLYVGYEGSGGH